MIKLYSKINCGLGPVDGATASLVLTSIWKINCVMLKCDGIAPLGRIRWCNVLAAYLVLVICQLETRNFLNRV